MKYVGKHLKQTSSPNNTKKALIASAVCTALCVLLLVSGTVAWFSANKESSVNEIYSGNLDVRLSYSKDMTVWKEVKDTTDDIFKVKEGSDDVDMLWEPGAANVVYFKIENKGNLKTKYDFAVEIAAEVEGTNFNNSKFKLSDYIKGGVVNVTKAFTADDAGRKDAITAVESNAKTLQEIHTGAPLITGEMKGAPTDNTTKTFALVLYMPDNVGDVTNYKTGDEYKPILKLKVKLIATQMTGEYDSFGDKYDKGAYEIKVVVPTLPENATDEQRKNAVTTAIASAIGEADNGSTILLPETTGKKEITLPEAVTSKDVVIKGAGRDKTEIANNTEQGLPGADLSIQDVTFVGAPKNSNYIGFQHTSTETYENCKFTGIRFFYGNTVVCKNCVFEQSDYEYCFWTYGSKDIIFENCTFNTKGKAAKVYNEAKEGTFNVTFKNCTFTSSENTHDKPAIAVNSLGAQFNVTVINCTATNFANGTSVEDSAMKTWYNGRMASAPAAARQLVGCEGQLDKITVTIDGTSY